jgi:ferritin
MLNTQYTITKEIFNQTYQCQEALIEKIKELAEKCFNKQEKYLAKTN